MNKKHPFRSPQLDTAEDWKCRNAELRCSIVDDASRVRNTREARPQPYPLSCGAPPANFGVARRLRLHPFSRAFVSPPLRQLHPHSSRHDEVPHRVRAESQMLNVKLMNLGNWRSFSHIRAYILSNMPTCAISSGRWTSVARPSLKCLRGLERRSRCSLSSWRTSSITRRSGN
jgi:hypothetical protein